MSISVGDKLPLGSFTYVGAEGPVIVTVEELTAGNKVALFGLPGAFTRTCSATHLPSFIQSAGALRAKGVDRIVCMSVNDPFVMKAWGEAHGAEAAGVEMLADMDGSFTKAIGLDFTTPTVGFFGRCTRFSAIIDDGVVSLMNLEETTGVCDITAGQTLVDQI